MKGSLKTIKRKQQLLVEYVNVGGNVSKATMNTNMNRQHYYEWYRTDEEFRNAIDKIDQTIVRFAECKLLYNAKRGDTKALAILLNRFNKNREMVENH